MEAPNLPDETPRTTLVAASVNCEIIRTRPQWNSILILQKSESESTERCLMGRKSEEEEGGTGELLPSPNMGGRPKE